MTQRLRILVAMDASASSLRAAEAACWLAALASGELRALYVEDEEVIRAASLPAARIVGLHSHQVRSLDPDSAGREVRGQGRRALRRIREIAGRRGVPFTFEVLQGPVTHTLVKAAADFDLVTLGRHSHRGGRTARLGRTARAVVQRAGRPVLLPGEVDVAGPPVVLYDGSSRGDRALSAARALFGDSESWTVVLVGPCERRQAMRERAVAVLGPVPRAGPPAFQSVSSVDEVHGLLRAHLGATLVAPVGDGMPTEVELSALLDEASGAVLLVP